jgi:hypothetical protein
MFGAVTTYLYEYILGIKQCKESYGFDKITISPMYVDGLDYAEGHITTNKGVISVSYKKDNGKVTLYLEIPDGIIAEVTTPLGAKVEIDKATKARFV